MNYSKKYNNGNPILSERLKALRNEKDISQEELAELIENNGGKCSSANYVSMMETAQRSISKSMAHCLARIFEIDASYLLDETVEYRTAAEKFKTEFQAAINESNQETYYMYNAICCLAALNGYTVEIKGKSDIANDVRKVLSTGKGKIGDSFKEYMVFYRNGKKEFSLSLEDANHFGNHINDVFLSHIKWNVKTE